MSIEDKGGRTEGRKNMEARSADTPRKPNLKAKISQSATAATTTHTAAAFSATAATKSSEVLKQAINTLNMTIEKFINSQPLKNVSHKKDLEELIKSIKWYLYFKKKEIS